MNIIQANIEHLEQVIPLFDAYRVFYRKPSDLEAARAFLTQRLQKQDSTIYLAIHEGLPVGFTQLYPSFSSTRMQRLWILNDLYVEKAYRGQGISKLLIDKAKVLAKNTQASGLLLETEANNHIGNKLYPSSGFKLEENNFYFWSSK